MKKNIWKKSLLRRKNVKCTRNSFNTKVIRSTRSIFHVFQGWKWNKMKPNRFSVSRASIAILFIVPELNPIQSYRTLRATDLPDLLDLTRNKTKKLQNWEKKIPPLTFLKFSTTKLHLSNTF